MIEVHALEMRYRGHVAVQSLSLSVAKGQLYALLGGNGAGKTTTLHAVLGLRAPAAGRIQVGAVEVSAGQRPRAVYVPEVVDLYPDLDAIETLELFAGVAGQSTARADLAGALTRAGLDAAAHHRRLRTYSKGMRQKVALALAEVQKSDLIVLDEPTSGLDPSAAAQLAERLAAAKAAGSTILMSTHDVLHLAGIADRVGILAGGRLLRELDATDMDGPALLAAYQSTISGVGQVV